jgi:hypothetical protein
MWLRRIGWFVVLWLAGVGAVTLVGLAIHYVLLA